MTNTFQNETTGQATPESVPAMAVEKVPFDTINKYAKLLHLGPYSKEAPEHKRRIAALQFVASNAPENTVAPPSVLFEEMVIPTKNSKLFNRYASSDAMFDHLKEEIIGQDAALRTIIGAMTKSDTESPIIRLYSKPGLGKSHLVNRVAKAIGADCNMFYAHPHDSLGSAIIESASTAFNKKVVLGIDKARWLTDRDQIILSELAQKQIPGADVAAIFLMDTESELTERQCRNLSQFDRLNEAFWSRVENVELTMPDTEALVSILKREGFETLDQEKLAKFVASGTDDLSVRSVIKAFHRQP
jgi:hypothetical protein